MNPNDLSVSDKCVIVDEPDYEYEITSMEWKGDTSKVSAIETDLRSNTSRPVWLGTDNNVNLVSHPADDFELDLYASPIGYHYICKVFGHHEVSKISEWLNEGDEKGYDLVKIASGGTGNNQVIYMRKAKNV